MKRISLNRYFIACLLPLYTGSPVFGQAGDHSRKNLSASLAEAKASAAVTVARGLPCIFDPQAYGWGAENRCPDAVITAVVVEQGGRRLIVPLSAFADLANPHSISLAGKNPRSFSLRISGGDAATAYRAVLQFNATGLVSRRVESGEFPRESNEVTTYRYNLVPR